MGLCVAISMLEIATTMRFLEKEAQVRVVEPSGWPGPSVEALRVGYDGRTPFLIRVKCKRKLDEEK